MKHPIAMAALAAALLTGCAHPRVKRSSQASAEPGDHAAGAAYPIEASRPEPDLRNAAMRVVPELATVYFDYNSEYLKPESRAVLAANAEWLRSHDKVRVQIAGNCDQRGTIGYNLALGQRRAAAVRDYYLHAGISGARLGTISYGKEHLLCQEPNEDCWQKNRRAETLEALSQNFSSLRRP